MITSDIIEISNYIYSASNELKIPVVEKIKSFSKFENHWHYGEGVKFIQRTLEAAIDLVSYLHNNLFDKFDAFPGFDGEILITCYSDKNVMDITINSDLTGYFNIDSLDGETLFKSNQQLINELKKEILSQRLLFFKEWNSLEYYQLSTMTEPLKDSKASHSKIRRRKKGATFPSLNMTAQLNVPTVFVNTSKGNTLFTLNHQYSGNSTLTFYQTSLD